MTYRLDACPRRRKDFVKMGNDSCPFFQGEVKGSERYGPCLIAIEYTKATTDDLQGTMDGPFIAGVHQGGEEILPPEGKDHLLYVSQSVLCMLS